MFLYDLELLSSGSTSPLNLFLLKYIFPGGNYLGIDFFNLETIFKNVTQLPMMFSRTSVISRLYNEKDDNHV